MDTIEIGNRILVLEVVHKPIKHTYIRIKAKNHLLITTSRQTKPDAIKQLIFKNQNKIIRMLDSLKDKPIFAIDKAMIFGVEYPILYREGIKSRVTLNPEELIVYGSRWDLQAKSIEKLYEKLVVDTAKSILEPLKTNLGTEWDLEGIMLKSQRMKTQLGSCIPSKRIIKLNSVLGRFDQKYLRMILIHELIHLKVSGHQANFYRLLLRYIPNYRMLRKELLEKLKTYEG